MRVHGVEICVINTRSKPAGFEIGLKRRVEEVEARVDDADRAARAATGYFPRFFHLQECEVRLLTVGEAGCWLIAGERQTNRNEEKRNAHAHGYILPQLSPPKKYEQKNQTAQPDGGPA
jgi:hypothetical protein